MKLFVLGLVLALALSMVWADDVGGYPSNNAGPAQVISAPTGGLTGQDPPYNPAGPVQVAVKPAGGLTGQYPPYDPGPAHVISKPAGGLMGQDPSYDPSTGTFVIGTTTSGTSGVSVQLSGYSGGNDVLGGDIWGSCTQWSDWRVLDTKTVKETNDINAGNERTCTDIEQQRTCTSSNGENFKPQLQEVRNCGLWTACTTERTAVTYFNETAGNNCRLCQNETWANSCQPAETNEKTVCDAWAVCAGQKAELNVSALPAEAPSPPAGINTLLASFMGGISAEQATILGLALLVVGVLCITFILGLWNKSSQEQPLSD